MLTADQGCQWPTLMAEQAWTWRGVMLRTWHTSKSSIWMAFWGL